MAENFTAFEYKTQEEVFIVIEFMTTVLSTAGSHVLEVLSPKHLLTNLHTPLVNSAPPSIAGPPISDPSSGPIPAPTAAPESNQGKGIPMEVDGWFKSTVVVVRS